uniref:Uncharacterized protein n=1 Tax=Vespula pensylvanica TaxID=30213 RepID=A0A834PAZ0_VESPE|nr:hypothetical protein H0235_002952 [Vespula pensylvanica]
MRKKVKESGKVKFSNIEVHNAERPVQKSRAYLPSLRCGCRRYISTTMSLRKEERTSSVPDDFNRGRQGTNNSKDRYAVVASRLARKLLRQYSFLFLLLPKATKALLD